VTFQPDMSRYPYDVIAVSSNSALDSYYVVPDWQTGAVNRAQRVYHTAGGKGINFARAFHTLGGRVLNLGIVGGHTGRFIADELARENIVNDLVWVDQETRRSSTIISIEAMQTTVMLDSGMRIAPEDGDRLHAKVMAHAQEAPFLVLTGSLPPGLPAHYFADIVRSASAVPDLSVCLDCSGDVLQSAARFGARVIKVNAIEYQASFPQPEGFNPASARRDFDTLHANGLEVLIVTDGPEGAYVFSVCSPPFKVKTQVEYLISTAGAGDTFLAGLLLSLSQGKGLEEAAAYASAAAASALQQIVCGSLALSEVDQFLSATHLHPLSV
jgi:1-phosphofructokinase family hexose kinase